MVCEPALPFGRCELSNSQDERKRELEYLRLASDLSQLARDTANPGLRLRCVRMARYWSDQAGGLAEKFPMQSTVYH
jgi:hypothetical protein